MADEIEDLVKQTQDFHRQMKIIRDIKNVDLDNLQELLDDIRDRHVFVTGKSRTGKTTLVENMALQDIFRGCSVFFIDPDGDAAKEILARIPKSRVPNTIYLEPMHHPIGIDFLHAPTPHDKARMLGDMVTIFKRLSEDWGTRMDAILRNVVATLLVTPGSTFLDIFRILDDEEFRDSVVTRLQDNTTITAENRNRLTNYWTQHFKKYPANAAEPLISRMYKFVMDPSLSKVVGSPNGISLDKLMSGDSIFIVDLVHVSPDIKGILASMIVSQIQLVLSRRAEIEKKHRPYVFLYIDEFQRLYVPGFEELCQQAGKFHLCMTLATHFPSQIKDDIRRNIMGIFGTFISLQLGAEEAPVMASALGVEPNDLIHLHNTKDNRLAYIIQPSSWGKANRFLTAALVDARDGDHSAEIKELNRQRFAGPPVTEHDDEFMPDNIFDGPVEPSEPPE